MEFKYGDRIHVTKFDGNLVDFYATVSCVYGMTVEIKNCTDTTYEEEVLYIPYSKSFGANRDDYFELVLDEEDTETPVIIRINDMFNEVPTQYVVEVEGSYVNDIHLRGSTKMGGYWGSYTPDNEKLDIRNVWITDDYRKALGIAYLVNGEVRKFKG